MTTSLATSTDDSHAGIDRLLRDEAMPRLCLRREGATSQVILRQHERWTVVIPALWTAIWSIGLSVCLWMSVTAGSYWPIAAIVCICAIPVGVWMVCVAWTGRVVVEIGPTDVEVTTQVLHCVMTRADGPLEELRSFRPILLNAEDRAQDSGLYLDGVGPRIFVLNSLSRYRATLLAELLNHLLEAARDGQWATVAGSESRQPAYLRDDSLPVPRPRQPAWREVPGATHPQWERRYEVRRNHVVGSLFWAILCGVICGFAVWVAFQLPPADDPSQSPLILAAMFSPFALASLGGVFYAIGELTAPITRTTLEIDGQSLVRQHNWGWFPMTQRFPLARIIRIDRVEHWRSWLATSGVRPRAFSLVFHGPGGAPQLKLNDLTEGDARWLTQQLVEAVPRWGAAGLSTRDTKRTVSRSPITTPLALAMSDVSRPSPTASVAQFQVVLDPSAIASPATCGEWQRLETGSQTIWQRQYQRSLGVCLIELVFAVPWAVASGGMLVLLFNPPRELIAEGNLPFLWGGWLAIFLLTLFSGIQAARSLTAHWRRLRIGIDDEQLCIQWEYGSLGHTRCWPLGTLSHVEVRDYRRYDNRGQFAGREFELRWMHSPGQTATVVKNLTRNEAHWLGQELVRAVPRWGASPVDGNESA